MEKLMLGFAGEIASGKGTATGLVKEWYPGTSSVRFSDPLREFRQYVNGMKARGLYVNWSLEDIAQWLCRGLIEIFPKKVFDDAPIEALSTFTDWALDDWLSYPDPVLETRENLQSLSTTVRLLFAENILERTMVERIARMKTQSPIAIIEGIRRKVDISNLLEEKNFRLVYVECDRQVAYERMKKRNENDGDANMTWEEFLKLSDAESEQQIRLLKPYAHLVINNSGSIEVLEQTLYMEVKEWLRS